MGKGHRTRECGKGMRQGAVCGKCMGKGYGTREWGKVVWQGHRCMGQRHGKSEWNKVMGQNNGARAWDKGLVILQEYETS